MRPNPYVVHALKYATLTLLGIVVVVASAWLLKQANPSSTSGRLVSLQQQGVIPTVKFDEQRAIEGFSAPADTSVIFTVPQGVRIPRITFFGGPDYDLKRYWGYCFSGNEAENKQKGLLGKAMYDGQFFYSLGERQAQTARPKVSDTDLTGILNSTVTPDKKAPASIAEILYGGQTCYVMSEVILPVGIDSDGDELNNERERELGTDPNNPDTDGDGIPDGTEVFVTKTNPKDRDTDHDGLPDRCEDKNMNGQVDPGETSPLLADTDRDGLCDGNPLDPKATGCPEPRQTFCTNDVRGGRTCMERPSSPVYGEDMNENCQVDQGETDPTNPKTFGIPDWDYKWNKLQSQLGNRTGNSAVGTPAPSFPIPNFPVASSTSSR